MERNRVVVSLSDETQEFQRGQATDARRMGRELNIDVEVVYAANSAETQSAQIQERIDCPEAERPAAIVTQPAAGDGEGLLGLAQEAAQKGVGWILLNRCPPYIRELRRAHPGLPIASVSSDQQEIGRLQGRQVLAHLKKAKAHALYVQGPPNTSAAVDRLKGIQEALGSSAVQLALDIVHADWSEAGGEQAAARALAPKPFWRTLMGRNAVPDAVIAQNDQMAMGARRAAQAAGLSLPVFGVDGLPEGGQRLVTVGELAATVIVVPNAGTAVHLVARHLWERHMPPPEILVSPLSFPSLAVLANSPR